MKERTILHCDLNNFFASVELLSKPDLRDKPVAVCGSVEKRHGIVLAKNDPAKKLGIKTAEAIWQAKEKCPDLIILEPHYEEYLKYSGIVRNILYDYTDMIEPFGIDESWMDVTDCYGLFGSGEKIAYKIKKRIKKETGLTVSVGVSFNKVFAKLGSDYKKPDAVTVISKENFKEKIYHLSADEMIGIGNATYKKLRNIGVRTIGDLASTEMRVLKSVFGVVGERLWYYANGLDMSPVIPESEAPAFKSISRSVTPEADMENNSEVWRTLLMLSEDLAKTMYDEGVSALKVTVMARDGNLYWQSFGQKQELPVKVSLDISRIAMNLFLENYDWRLPLRSIGICVSEFINSATPVQTSLYISAEEQIKQEILEEKVFDLREKYGKKSIVRARLMNSRTELAVKTLPSMHF